MHMGGVSIIRVKSRLKGEGMQGRASGYPQNILLDRRGGVARVEMIAACLLYPLATQAKH
jgi:hypothetical protein